MSKKGEDSADEQRVVQWCKDSKLPACVVNVLITEGFDSLSALKCIELTDLDALAAHLKRGHLAQLRCAVRTLQQIDGEGPLSDSASGAKQVTELLARLNLDGSPAAMTPKPKGEMALRIVDFVSAAVAAEEEVVLGGGVTIKLPNAKPKLDKVSPSAWIVANSRIMAALMARDPDSFDVAAYIRYTEMVGELGCRFTWQSVLIFDDEYRQRQAADKFPWGTEAPHLATVVLRDRTAPATTKKPGSGGGNNSGHRQRPTGPGGKEVCLQFNKGSCAYGPRCIFEHACSSCGKDHPATQHSAQPSSA